MKDHSRGCFPNLFKFVGSHTCMVLYDLHIDLSFAIALIVGYFLYFLSSSLSSVSINLLKISDVQLPFTALAT